MPSLFALEFLSCSLSVTGTCPTQAWLRICSMAHALLSLSCRAGIFSAHRPSVIALQKGILCFDGSPEMNLLARHHKSSFFSILQLKLNMLIVPIISGTCCFISNTEICVLISQLMLVSIHGCTALVGGQNCDKIDRNFCNVCYIEPIFCQASLVTLKIIKQPSCN